MPWVCEAHTYIRRRGVRQSQNLLPKGVGQSPNLPPRGVGHCQSPNLLKRRGTVTKPPPKGSGPLSVTKPPKYERDSHQISSTWLHYEWAGGSKQESHKERKEPIVGIMSKREGYYNNYGILQIMPLVPSYLCSVFGYPWSVPGYPGYIPACPKSVPGCTKFILPHVPSAIY